MSRRQRRSRRNRPIFARMSGFASLVHRDIKQSARAGGLVIEDVPAATSLVLDGDLANALRTGDIAAFTLPADRHHLSFHPVSSVGSDPRPTSFRRPPCELTALLGVPSVGMEKIHKLASIARRRRLDSHLAVHPRAAAR